MIKLSTLMHQEIYLNCELFEKIDANPDTVITMSNGNKYIVDETPEQVVKKIKDYKKEILMKF